MTLIVRDSRGWRRLLISAINGNKVLLIQGTEEDNQYFFVASCYCKIKNNLVDNLCNHSPLIFLAKTTIYIKLF